MRKARWLQLFPRNRARAFWVTELLSGHFEIRHKVMKFAKEHNRKNNCKQNNTFQLNINLK